MRRMSIVVQRYGNDFVGGAERHALEVAKILSKKFVIEIITTCAYSHETWENHYPNGRSKDENGFDVIRFKTDFERDKTWHFMNEILMDNTPMDSFHFIEKDKREALKRRIRETPISFSKEWMKKQGPYSSEMLRYISFCESEYFLFFTYLYPTTYFGSLAVTDARKVRIIPTFHDEPVAYLPIFRNYSVFKHLFSTNAERMFVENELYPDKNMSNEVINYGLKECRIDSTHNIDDELYILYAGRLEEAKGVKWLYEIFVEISSVFPSLKLYTIGDGYLKNYKHPHIAYKGFVSEEEKLRLMNGAVALVHPSSFESMSIVVLEAFMQSCPCIVNEKCAVLAEHIEISGGGFVFNDSTSLREAIQVLLSSPKRAKRLGENGYRYYKENYSYASYASNLLDNIFV